MEERGKEKEGCQQSIVKIKINFSNLCYGRYFINTQHCQNNKRKIGV